MVLLSGIALSPKVLGRYRRHSKNGDVLSVLRVRTSWCLANLPPPASDALDPLPPYCYNQAGTLLLPPLSLSSRRPPSSSMRSSSGALSPVTRDHVREAVIVFIGPKD